MEIVSKRRLLLATRAVLGLGAGAFLLAGALFNGVLRSDGPPQNAVPAAASLASEQASGADAICTNAAESHAAQRDAQALQTDAGEK